MKRALFAFVFMCLAASVASASSSCLAENGVAGGHPATQSLTDQLISSSGTGTAYSGYLDSCAYIDDAANPFGAGDVTIIYQAIAGSAPSSDIHSITFGDFGGASLTGAQASCSGCTASSSFGANGSGGFFFDFFPVIPVNGQSDYLIVYTDQTNIATGLASLHDTSETGVASDLAIAPEPGSIALVGTGLIGLAGLLRRKFLQA
jgi:hypothetical protein